MGEQIYIEKRDHWIDQTMCKMASVWSYHKPKHDLKAFPYTDINFDVMDKQSRHHNSGHFSLGKAALHIHSPGNKRIESWAYLHQMHHEASQTIFILNYCLISWQNQEQNGQYAALKVWNMKHSDCNSCSDCWIYHNAPTIMQRAASNQSFYWWRCNQTWNYLSKYGVQATNSVCPFKRSPASFWALKRI